MTDATNALSPHDEKLLQKGLDEVSALREQKAAIDSDINGWLDTLQRTFGEHVSYENEAGQTIKFRLAHVKSTSHKKVLDKVRENAGPTLARFIDTEREAESKESVRKVLTASKPKNKGGHGTRALTKQQVKDIRTARMAGSSINALAKQYGVSGPTIKSAELGKGAYHKG